MSNAFMWQSSIKSQGAIYLPTASRKQALIHPHDIAAVAAKVLTAPGHAGKVYELTGSSARPLASLSSTLTSRKPRSGSRWRSSCSLLKRKLWAALLPHRMSASIQAKTIQYKKRSKEPVRRSIETSQRQDRLQPELFFRSCALCGHLGRLYLPSPPFWS